MRVTVRLYAMLRQQAGWRERVLELPTGATIDTAWQALVGLVPEFAGQRDAVRFARNRGYASSTETLAEGDELVLIPPVAGGATNRLARIEIIATPIDDSLLAELRRTVPTAADGALVLFVGQTRDSPGTPAPGQEAEASRHSGQRVLSLEYEAFEELALDVLRAIAGEIETRFAVRRLAIIHRTGAVAVGEPSVVVAAAAPHRAAAFDACRYAIEELKARAPIWKAELFAGGQVWMGVPARETPPR